MKRERERKRERKSIDFNEVDSLLEKVNILQRNLLTQTHTHTHTRIQRVRKRKRQWT